MAGYSVTYSVVDNATRQIDAINKRIAQMRAPMERMSRSVSKFIDASGLRRVADGFNWIGRAVQTVFRSMLQIVPVLGTITGAATIAGMVKLVSTWAAFGKTLQTDSQQIGTTTQELQKLQDATTLAGGDAKDMTETLKNLQSISANAFAGQNNEALAWFNRFGISLRDANGNLRSTTELLPEVFKALDSLKNPTDRARVAAALLGDEQAKLYYDFKNSGKSLDEWLGIASKYQELSKEQIDTLRDYRQAQAAVGVSFEHLGQQISVTMATAFTPFLRHLSEFVDKHTPEILAAIDKVVAAFSAWLDRPEMFQHVLDGINAAVEAIKFLVDNINTVVTVAEVVAGIFATRWAIGIVRDIGYVVAAIGSLGGGAAGAAAASAGGTGLVGALAAVAAIAGALAAAAGIHKGIEAGSEFLERKMFGDERTDARKQMQQQGFDQFRSWLPSWLGGRPMPQGGGVQRQGFTGPPISSDISPEGAALLKTIATGESGGDPSILYGGGHFSGSQFPEWSGKDNSHAAGRYQFQPATWRGVQAKTGLTDFSPESQDKGAWYLAQSDYRRRTGRDLAVDLKDPNKAPDIGAALQPTWTSANSGGWASSLRKRLNETSTTAQAPPVAPPAAAPTNGSVDVSITHSNPPPNTSITATGQGAVRVAPPRTEYSDMFAGA